MAHVIEWYMGRVSEFTIRRLSAYFRILADLEHQGVKTVSSAKLAELGGITSAQVRKDLSYFGNFGTRGLGYKVTELKEAIIDILGLKNRWRMALFGAGSLGHALFFYDGFKQDGFLFTHIFDIAPNKIGQNWNNVEIHSVKDAKTKLIERPADVAVVTTPAPAARALVELLIVTGFRGVLNFAPVRLKLPDTMWLRNVNLAVALESLSFYMSAG